MPGAPVDQKAAFNNFPYQYGVVERTFSEYKSGLLSQTLVSSYPTLPAELQAGAPAVIEWANCGREDYAVQSVETLPPSSDSLTQQTGSGLLVLVPAGPAGGGFLVRGARPDLALTPQPAGQATPGPETSSSSDAAPGGAENAIQSSLTFLENAISADGKQIRMRLSITNSGGKAFSIKERDIHLETGDGAPVALQSIQSTLPLEVPPGGTVELVLVFENPGQKVLVFSQFTSLLSILRHRLDRDHIPYEYLDGGTRDRQARVERFQKKYAKK